MATDLRGDEIWGMVWRRMAVEARNWLMKHQLMSMTVITIVADYGTIESPIG